jgi:amino acid adenylation domain-containing protein
MTVKTIQGYRLSPQQLQVWLSQTDNDPCVVQCVVTIAGEFDCPRLSNAIDTMVERHEILRTAFQCLPGMNEPLQVISATAVASIGSDDLSDLSEAEAERQFQELCQRDRRRHPELEQGGLLICSLVKFSTARHSLVLTLPAICGDVETLKNLVAEIANSYAAEIVEAGEPIQYADCAEVLNELIEGGETEAGRDYWRKKLDGALFEVKLPSANNRTNKPANAASFKPDFVSIQLDTKLADDIAAQANALGVSNHSLLLAGWQTLLARLTGLKQIPVGVSYDGRTYEEVEKTAGPFAKYLPLIGETSAVLPFAELVTRIDAELREMREWQDYFSAKQLDDGNSGGIPVCFSFHEHSSVYPTADLTFTVTQEYECASRFELKLGCTLTGEALVSIFYYDASIYSRASMARLAEQYRKLLSEALKNPQILIGELEILGDSERQFILREFTNTEKSYGAAKCLHTYFEEQAAQTPDLVALVYEEVQLTYAELNRRANQLAHHLRGLGVGTETFVAICIERSVEMVVGLLGVLKAGGAYVPLDPSHPQQRWAFTLNDTHSPLVLTQASLAAGFAEQTARVLSLDSDWDAISGENEENPVGVVEPANLAYVIYTSGSTGQPKGVQVTHRAVNNHLLWQREQTPLDTTDRLLQKTSYTFDASIWEFFLPLMCGAQLVLARPGGHQDSAYLVEMVATQKITVLQVVPTMLRALLAERDIVQCRSLRMVFCGGEVVTVELQERFFSLFPETQLYNFYGPTEAAIDVTCWHCERDSGEEFVSIGKALNNVQLYVLDAQLQPVPLGMDGELYIGGTSLARGYLRRPELTAERFIPNPYSASAGTRLYRTGDLVRYHEDGRLEFAGRKDSQVKLRGFRIELGEIESVLDQHESLKTCVVVVRPDTFGEQKIVAFVVPGEGQTIGTAELRQFLSERLPVYMIPMTFVTLETLPLLSSGKVDRNALPALEAFGEAEEREYLAPQTPVEEMLAGIWAEVLNLERVSLDDNFFDLGGHSLLVTQVLSRVRDAFSVQLPLRNFFEAPSLKALAADIEGELQTGRGLQSLPVQPVSRDVPLPLSFAQQRLWFLNQMEPDSALYNIPTAVRLRGVLDVAALEETFTEIIRRHESLRTTFTLADGVPVQVTSSTFDLPFRTLDLATVAESKRDAQALRLATEESLRPFNLEHGPVIRILLLKLSDEEHLLVCTTHHVVSDLWSRAVLLREVSQLYAGLTQRTPVQLRELPIQYADHAYWERQLLQGELLEAELTYWKEQLLDAPVFLNLPTDRPRPAVQSSRGGKEGIALPQELFDGLRALSRREGTTMFMTLLAAFNVLLARYSGQQDLLVGTPVSNRDRVEIEGLVGFFANTLVMRTDTSGNPTFRELLHRVRETSLSAYAHRVLPFEMLVEELQPQRDAGYTPLFQVMFAHQMAPRETFALPGLSLERIDIGNQSSKFDLTIFFVERPENMSAWFEYNTDLFDATTIQRLLSHLQTLLESITANPEQSLRDLSLLTDTERCELLYERNDTERPLPQVQNIQQLFEDQVERTPERIALVFEEQELTYAELNERANQLAHYLRELGIGPDRFVGLLMSRSVEMMVSVLGVLKAGGAYAALDPNYPKERLAFMLEDTRASVILTQESLRLKLPDHPARVVVIEEEWQQITTASKQNPSRIATSENLTYVTYTSGSTGKPKGIAMPQRALLNLINWQVKETRLPDGARTLQFASLGFDVSFQDMFSTWASGGTLVMITDEQRQDIGGLTQVITEQNAQRLFIPAVALQQLAEGFCKQEQIRASLLKIIAGSEQLQITRSIARMFTELSDCRLHNEYGPSEAHVVTELALPPNPEDWPERPSVGRPIYNARIYILDRQMQPTPIGVPGELLIGGPGLARGYLNRPDLTADRFIPDPIGNTPGERLYRTGDLARWLANGEIEFLGRMDFQVKIRGFRVEPGEVEVVLSAHEEVRETLVLVREDTPGDKRLVAYVVPRDDASFPNVSELRRFLQDQLPDYMIPSAFVMLDVLPLTPNGKVNRSALPAPDQTRPDLEQQYVPPVGAIEEVIAAHWAEALKIERVGREDNFFALGGHSLLAIAVVARLREIFPLELPFRVLFDSPTVGGLAAYLLNSAERREDLEEIAATWQELNGLLEEEAAAMLVQESAAEAHS